MAARPSPVSFTLAVLVSLFNICFMTAAKPAALLVFGDSYADTGNHNASDPGLYTPWQPPYGETWPRRPSGRFSDGVVLTDEVARYFGLPAPVPYRSLESPEVTRIAPGINFAFGGSGLFPTFGPSYPNVSIQVSQFRETIARGMFSKDLLPASLALLVVAGNDYTAYSLQHPGDKGVAQFVLAVVAEMARCLQALYDVGVRSFAVTNLEPFGCFPAETAKSNYKSCNVSKNAFSVFHNEALATQMSLLRTKNPEMKLQTLDLYGAFKAVMDGGELRWKSCCQGAGDGGSCGRRDSSGRHLYSLCSTPSKSFFWDSVHPTHAGWKAIAQKLFSN